LLDLVVANAWIIDGSGRPGFPGHVGIRGGRITAILRGEPPGALETIDAKGMVVCPGFVDIHSHSDRSILIHPQAKSSLLQGITTEISGNCGSSMAPMSSRMAERIRSLSRQLAGKEMDIDLDWRDVEGFLKRLEATGIGNNQGIFVGQGTIRGLVMGQEKRYPRPEELQEMKNQVELALQQGAFGISTGRAYVPGCFASFYEVVELTRVVGAYGALYTSHIQDQWANVHRSTWEVVEISRRTGAAGQIAHQKVVGKDNWGRAAEILSIMERARQAGVDIMSDVYPYPYSAVISLERVLPETLKGKDERETLAKLNDAEAVESMRKHLKTSPSYLTARLELYGIVQCAEQHQYEGMDLGEAAACMGVDVAEAVVRLLRDNELKVKIAGIMSEDDVREIIRHPLSMISTDAAVRDSDADAELGWSTVHPRHYGTYPRVLGKYVREERLLTLEEAIRKMTALPAERVGIPDRGYIRRGYWADLVIFDPQTIRDRATIEDPTAPPEGIKYVLVNGQVAVKEGKVQEHRAGQVLRHPHGRMLY